MPTVSFNTNFPGYDVLGEINRSNARVLKARHIATGDLVAIKHFSLNTDADTLRRFERESAIMTRMSHPNIVRVREVRLDTDLPYLVMDYVEGGSLRHLLSTQHNLPVDVTIRLGLQMLDVFRLIHAQGIIHRDLKPENILYRQLSSGELHFLLTDFGVARLHEQPVTVTGQSLMTYEYAAPEQFDNPRQIDEAADYYALGVVLYECLTGRVPFAMRDESGLVTFMNMVLSTPPPPPVLPTGEALPGSMVALLDQLLTKNCRERLHNPDVAKLALKQAEVEQLYHQQKPVSGQTVAFRPPVREKAAPETPVRPVSNTDKERITVPRRSRAVWPMAALVGALLLTGLWVYWYFTPTASRPVTPGLAGVSRAENSESDSETFEFSDLTVSAAEKRAQEERRRQLALEAARKRYQEEVSRATKQLEATAFGGKVGFFGGVKGLSVKLENPSTVTFKSVAVQVTYVKDNGDTFKSPIMYFNNIGPGGSITRRAPDSQRGIRFSAKVLRADAAPSDSLASSSLPNP